MKNGKNKNIDLTNNKTGQQEKNSVSHVQKQQNGQKADSKEAHECINGICTTSWKPVLHAA